MKILIYTFSGTGNTFLTADFIAEALNTQGSVVLQYKIEDVMRNESTPDVHDAQHILIGYPIHAFNAPEIVVSFVKTLPISDGKKVSVFKTSGEPFFFNNSSSHLLIKHLQSKGYDYMVETHFLMPYNIVFRYPDALAKQMYLFMQDMAADFADAVLNGSQKRIPFTVFTKIISFVFRIQWSGARLNGRFYSCLHKKCTLCLKCINNCPAQNIHVSKSKIRFDGKCMMCMCCVQNCSYDAINIGLLRYWPVRGNYDFKSLSNDDSISSDYVNEATRGYFRLFRSFFRQ